MDYDEIDAWYEDQKQELLNQYIKDLEENREIKVKQKIQEGYTNNLKKLHEEFKKRFEKFKKQNKRKDKIKKLKSLLKKKK